ncbi:MAG: nicotinate-nucleotide--dimethylbenzimidazole phosphoribosyltransferase [Candidatus Thiodiazotropha sp.]
MNNHTAWLYRPAALPDSQALNAATRRQQNLTKPPGALGKLEDLAIRLAALQRRDDPQLDRIQITIFAGDHGVCEEGVSAFPQAVTAQMVENFAHQGAAISVLANTLEADLEVINLGTVNDPGPLPKVTHLNLGPCTENICYSPAMDEWQLTQALNAGRQSVERALESNKQLYVAGEMGIGNTTSATALACALLSYHPEQIAGPGSGLDAQGVANKVRVVSRALARHQSVCDNPLETLRRLGGFEIAALAGAYIAAAQSGLAVVVDGFIATVAALVAERHCQNSKAWMIFSHTSAEPGHQALLENLQAEPLLNLQMRLGEASGAACAIPLLRMACALHTGMATFTEAGVASNASHAKSSEVHPPENVVTQQ